jgi:hypothetical protein
MCTNCAVTKDHPCTFKGWGAPCGPCARAKRDRNCSFYLTPERHRVLARVSRAYAMASPEGTFS